jgi:hypothetical protein
MRWLRRSDPRGLWRKSCSKMYEHFPLRARSPFGMPFHITEVIVPIVSPRTHPASILPSVSSCQALVMKFFPGRKKKSKSADVSHQKKFVLFFGCSSKFKVFCGITCESKTANSVQTNATNTSTLSGLSVQREVGLNAIEASVQPCQPIPNLPRKQSRVGLPGFAKRAVSFSSGICSISALGANKTEETSDEISVIDTPCPPGKASPKQPCQLVKEKDPQSIRHSYDSQELEAFRLNPENVDSERARSPASVHGAYSTPQYVQQRDTQTFPLLYMIFKNEINPDLSSRQPSLNLIHGIQQR